MKAGGNPAPWILPATEKNGPLFGLKTITVYHQCVQNGTVSSPLSNTPSENTISTVHNRHTHYLWPSFTFKKHVLIHMVSGWRGLVILPFILNLYDKIANMQKRNKKGNKNGLNLSYSQKKLNQQQKKKTMIVHLVWRQERKQKQVTVCTHLKK